MRVTVRRHDSSWEGMSGGPPGRWSGGRLEVDLPEGTTVADLIRLVRVDARLVALVAVNGRSAEPATALADGDSVDLVPPITGG